MHTGPTVETLRGPLPVDRLGRVLMHEHVVVRDIEYTLNHGWDEHRETQAAIARLRALAARGISTIADPTVQGIGLDIHLNRRVAEAVDGLNIIPATGVYFRSTVPERWAYRGPGCLIDDGTEPLVDAFVRDLTVGIGDSGVKAAFLKGAIWERTHDVERALRAIARAHTLTGAPITVHTSTEHRSGLAALDIFEEEHVDLAHVVLGHSGDTDDLDYLRRLIDRGCLLGMDRFGLDTYLTTERRVATVARLASEGLAERMVLSQDACSHLDWIDADLKERMLPDWHYTFVSDSVLPALRDGGVTDRQIHTMLVDNPRAYFTPAG